MSPQDEAAGTHEPESSSCMKSSDEPSTPVKESIGVKRTHGNSPASSPTGVHVQKRLKPREDSIERRRVITPPPSPENEVATSADFWYRDGNVVIRIGSIAFRLYRDRLARQCTYFAKLFEEEQHVSRAKVIDLTQDNVKVKVEEVEDTFVTDVPNAFEGAKVYTLTGLIKAQDFVFYLASMDGPVNSSGRVAEEAAIGLLRAGYFLGCEKVLSIAKNSLHVIWPSHHPPPAGKQFTHARAIEMVDVARQYRVSGVLKFAYYQILASDSFWQAFESNRASIPLSDTEIIRLVRARSALQRVWRELVRTPPNTRQTGQPNEPVESLCISWVQGQQDLRFRCNKVKTYKRTLHWHMAFRHHLEAAETDPFWGLCLISRKHDILKNVWCERCLEERRRVWGEARGKWWGWLDTWLGLF